MDQPTELQVDNYATVNRNGAPIRKWSPASKHYDTLERYIGECVEDEIIRLRHVPGRMPEYPQSGDGFRVDALTKALSPATTRFYFNEIHGPDILTGTIDGGKSKTILSSRPDH